MNESVHGHQVMQMMMAAGRGFQREELIAAMAQAFGEQARYHTCSRQQMTAAELVELLLGKGKFVEQADGWHVDSGRICRH